VTELLSDWETQALSKVTSLIRDGSHGTHSDVADGVPLLSAKDVRDGTVDIPADCRRIPLQDYQSLHRHYELQKDDILLTIVGTIGRCCLLTGDEPKFTFQRSVSVLRPSTIAPSYLCHYLRSEPFQTTLKALTNASAQGGVYLGALATCEVCYPRFRLEQAKIAEVLSAVDSAIEQTAALVAKQLRIRTGLLQDLLTCGIDQNGIVRSESTHRFKHSSMGRIPEGWEVSPAESLCDAVIDCKNRTPPVTDEGYPVIRTPNVRNGEFVFPDLTYTDSHSYEIWTARGKPRTGDVVITREAPFGEACEIPSDLTDSCLGQRMMMYQPNPKKLRSDYLVYAIYSEAVRAKLLELAGGSTVGHIRVGDVRRLPIPHPVCIREQGRIAAVLTASRTAIQELRIQLDKLSSLKAGLMQDLLTGRVRVTPLLEAGDQLLKEAS